MSQGRSDTSNPSRIDDRVKSLLRRIARKLRASVDGDAFALEELLESMTGPAVSPEDLDHALDAIEALAEPAEEELYTEPEAARTMNRVLSPEERSRLTTEAYGYLLGARADGMLDDEQFEWVLERALASPDRPIGLGEIQDLVLEAVFGSPDETEEDFGDLPRIH